ncbi:MAG: hypothetical protein WA719_03140 [Thermoplasmata archaeon]
MTMVLVKRGPKPSTTRVELSKEDCAGCAKAEEQGEPTRVFAVIRDRASNLDENQARALQKWLLDHEREVTAMIVTAAKKHQGCVIEPSTSSAEMG